MVRAKFRSSFRHAIAFRAAVQVNDLLPMAARRDLLAFEGPKHAFDAAYKEAGISVNDLSFAEVHDCFTIAELLSYEAMGLAEPGHGARCIEDGTVMLGGRLPVNPSGGLKAKGHPVGATGVSMHVLSARQLCGDMGELQVRDAVLLPGEGGVDGGEAGLADAHAVEPPCRQHGLGQRVEVAPEGALAGDRVPCRKIDIERPGRRHARAAAEPASTLAISAPRLRRSSIRS